VSSPGRRSTRGGSEGRVEATGRSVALSAREAFDWLDRRDIAGATVAVQGYGNAGSIAAALLADLGADVVAVSDSSGGIHAPTGSTPPCRESPQGRDRLRQRVQ